MISRAFSTLAFKVATRNQSIFFRGINSLCTKHFSTKKSADDFIHFPRDDQGINSALNWALTKAYVTPFHKISYNAIEESGIDNNRTKVVALKTNQFTDLNERIGETISNSEIVYVIEGELEGLYVRIITGNEAQAKNARGVLNKVKDPEFSANITVLLQEDEELNGKTIVNPSSGVILSQSANKESLIEACDHVLNRV